MSSRMYRAGGKGAVGQGEAGGSVPLNGFAHYIYRANWTRSVAPIGVRMSQRLHVAFVAALFIGSIGCAATGGASLQAGSQIAIEGAIASIDTAPWAYDGNAV